MTTASKDFKLKEAMDMGAKLSASMESGEGADGMELKEA